LIKRRFALSIDIVFNVVLLTMPYITSCSWRCPRELSLSPVSDTAFSSARGLPGKLALTNRFLCVSSGTTPLGRSRASPLSASPACSASLRAWFGRAAGRRRPREIRNALLLTPLTTACPSSYVQPPRTPDRTDRARAPMQRNPSSQPGSFSRNPPPPSPLSSLRITKSHQGSAQWGIGRSFVDFTCRLSAQHSPPMTDDAPGSRH